MQYKEFLNLTKEELNKQLTASTTVILNTVTKNNGLILDALNIKKPGICMTPNIFMNRYYEEYLNGTSVDTITKEILNISNANKNLEEDIIHNIADFERITAQITYRIINAKMNEERLKVIPHQLIEDLAKVYYLIMSIDENGISSTAITYDLLEQWNVNLELVDQHAVINTPRLFPFSIKSMNEIMKEIIIEKFTKDKMNLNSEDNYLYNEILNEFDDQNSTNEDTMYVLTNSKGINGASTILYPDVLRNFAIQHQSNFYILPSSTHEVILIPSDKQYKKETLKQMVMEVNESQVPQDEILSNEVYYYNLLTDKFYLFED